MTSIMPIGRRVSRAWYFALFTLSGFAGLIYESIWSHYLKLFLGHAAYAQALVLAIFMGGMALGAWYCGLRSRRWRNLLLAYAVAEAIIGVCALVFHPVFTTATGFAYDTVFPALAGSPVAVAAFKWLFAILLILPQSVLLGMTFPLMSAGLLRLHPERQGESIAMLYFTNSLGAAAGVLASGFVLVRTVGLPGTMLTAGLLNLALALVVWLLAKGAEAPAAATGGAPAQGASGPGRRLLLAVSLLTGAASFMYEVGWIRMLSMVLSSSTHAFELMLSAFILGLACGGLWIKRRIDAIADPGRFLAWVQVAMGLLALATLPVYGWTFEWMQALLATVARTDAGYAAFNAGSHLIALLVMFPAAFCAGMTLPLITCALLRAGNGEGAIGAVYAANTVGAIAGVFVAVHLAMPLLGLKGLIMAGAVLDVGLGLVLLRQFAAARADLRLAATAAGLAVVAALAWAELDQLKMASGVYRQGLLPRPEEGEVLFHRDGKTTTVALLRAGGLLSITTNGKSDAMVAEGPQAEAAGDEPTMIMTGALPLVLHPGARTAAVIGIGSGISSHVLLSADSLREVETIEIEPAMVEAARGFGARNRLVFDDPRSRIAIEDAKTHFATRGRRYDIIVSEPSNPWVSGVASLFTAEFYALMTRHLEPGGLFVQWIQLYEIDTVLVASIMKALARHFSHYEIYAADDYNLIIAARDGLPLPAPAAAAFRHPRLAQELARIGVLGPADLDVFRLGSERVLQPFFERFAIPPNSDFFPVLDQNAARARFMASRAREIIALSTLPIPAAEFLGGARSGGAVPPPRAWLRRSGLARAAVQGRAYLMDGDASRLEALPAGLRSEFELVRLALLECPRPPRTVTVAQLYAVADALLPYLAPDRSGGPWAQMRTSRCARLTESQAGLLTLFSAIAARDAAAMAHVAEALLEGADPALAPRRDFLLAAAVLGRIATGERARAAALWSRHAGGVSSDPENVLPELLHGHLLAPPARQ